MCPAGPTHTHTHTHTHKPHCLSSHPHQALPERPEASLCVYPIRFPSQDHRAGLPRRVQFSFPWGLAGESSVASGSMRVVEGWWAAGRWIPLPTESRSVEIYDGKPVIMGIWEHSYCVKHVTVAGWKTRSSKPLWAFFFSPGNFKWRRKMPKCVFPSWTVHKKWK